MSLLKTAFQFIRYDKAKSIGVTVGIVISTFLIGQQLGILDFLTSLMVASADNTEAEVWVVDSKSRDLNQLGRMDVRKLREVKSVPGVEAAFPLVFASGSATFPNGASANLLLLGSPAPQLLAGPDPGRIIGGALGDLRFDGAISADLFDAPALGGSTEVGTRLEINGKRAEIRVQTRGVRGFGNPIAYTTLERARYFGNLPNTTINAVLLRCDPAEVPQVIAYINAQIAGVRAWRTAELKQSTIDNILAASGIAASTGSLIIFALIAGFFIIGLTLYSAALDRLRDYGTLKAIGASNGYLTRLILTQAVLFAVVGFVLAMGLLQGFRLGVAESGVLFELPPLVLAGIFALVLFISVGGSSFALRRIRNVEPASVFR